MFNRLVNIFRDSNELEIDFVFHFGAYRDCHFIIVFERLHVTNVKEKNCVVSSEARHVHEHVFEHATCAGERI